VLYGFRRLSWPATTPWRQGRVYLALARTEFFCNSRFGSWIGWPRPQHFDLWIAAFKKETLAAEMQQIARDHLP